MEVENDMKGKFNLTDSQIIQEFSRRSKEICCTGTHHVYLPAGQLLRSSFLDHSLQAKALGVMFSAV